jgi:putative tricarboxylic transport membrane protein
VKINDAVFGGLLLVLGLAVLLHVQAFPTIPGQDVGPGLFPGLVAAGLVVCAVLLIASGVRERREGWVVLFPWTRSPRHLAAFVAVVGTTIAYILFAERIGFLVLAPIALFAMFVAFGVRAGLAAIVAIIAALVIWYAFYKLLRVPLPWGILERFAF